MYRNHTSGLGLITTWGQTVQEANGSRIQPLQTYKSFWLHVLCQNCAWNKLRLFLSQVIPPTNTINGMHLTTFIVFSNDAVLADNGTQHQWEDERMR